MSSDMRSVPDLASIPVSERADKADFVKIHQENLKLYIKFNTGKLNATWYLYVVSADGQHDGGVTHVIRTVWVVPSLTAA